MKVPTPYEYLTCCKTFISLWISHASQSETWNEWEDRLNWHILEPFKKWICHSFLQEGGGPHGEQLVIVWLVILRGRREGVRPNVHNVTLFTVFGFWRRPLDDSLLTPKYLLFLEFETWNLSKRTKNSAWFTSTRGAYTNICGREGGRHRGLCHHQEGPRQAPRRLHRHQHVSGMGGWL